MFAVRVVVVAALTNGVRAPAQEPSTSYVVHPNQIVRVANLQVRTSGDPATPLQSALATIFQDPAMCCGKDSALGDAAEASSHGTPQELAAKLQGRHTLGDGLTSEVSVKALNPGSVVVDDVIASLKQNRPLLMQWNSRWYVVTGAVFDEYLYSDGTRTNSIRKLLLLDFRVPSAPKEAVFDRLKDDWSKVQGLLLVDAGQKAAPQAGR